MRMRLPLALGFLTGMFVLIQFFIPHHRLAQALDMLTNWGIIIGTFALILGLASLLRSHLDKIRQRRPAYAYSFVTLISFALMLVLGLFWGADEGTPFNWLFKYVQVPLDSTVFSLLAFFMASAAYRSFRARSIEATILLIAAVIVILGRVPISGQIPHLHGAWPHFTEWLMIYPAVGAKRGIIFGVALGIIATSLRIILGIERSHLGGE
jgi:predicted permease